MLAPSVVQMPPNLSMVPIRGSLRPPALATPFSNNSAASTWHTEYFFCEAHQHSSGATPAAHASAVGNRTRHGLQCQYMYGLIALFFQRFPSIWKPCMHRMLCAALLHERQQHGMQGTHNLLWVPDTKLDGLDTLHRSPTGREAVHGGRHGCWKPPKGGRLSCKQPPLLLLWAGVRPYR